jgi:hypothetical protein
MISQSIDEAAISAPQYDPHIGLEGAHKKGPRHRKRRERNPLIEQEMKMRKLLTMSLVALSLAGTVATASAQTYGRSPEAKQQESSQPSTPSNATDRAYLAE